MLSENDLNTLQDTIAPFLQKYSLFSTESALREELCKLYKLQGHDVPDEVSLLLSTTHEEEVNSTTLSNKQIHMLQYELKCAKEEISHLEKTLASFNVSQPPRPPKLSKWYWKDYELKHLDQMVQSYLIDRQYSASATFLREESRISTTSHCCNTLSLKQLYQFFLEDNSYLQPEEEATPNTFVDYIVYKFLPKIATFTTRTQERGMLYEMVFTILHSTSSSSGDDDALRLYLLNSIFEWISHPNESQRSYVLSQCIRISRNIGSRRTECELLSAVISSLSNTSSTDIRKKELLVEIIMNVGPLLESSSSSCNYILELLSDIIINDANDYIIMPVIVLNLSKLFLKNVSVKYVSTVSRNMVLPCLMCDKTDVVVAQRLVMPSYVEWVSQQYLVDHWIPLIIQQVCQVELSGSVLLSLIKSVEIIISSNMMIDKTNVLLNLLVALKTSTSRISKEDCREIVKSLLLMAEKSGRGQISQFLKLVPENFATLFPATTTIIVPSKSNALVSFLLGEEGGHDSSIELLVLLPLIVVGFILPFGISSDSSSTDKEEVSIKFILEVCKSSELIMSDCCLGELLYHISCYSGDNFNYQHYYLRLFEQVVTTTTLLQQQQQRCFDVLLSKEVLRGITLWDRINIMIPLLLKRDGGRNSCVISFLANAYTLVSEEDEESEESIAYVSVLNCFCEEGFWQSTSSTHRSLEYLLMSLAKVFPYCVATVRAEGIMLQLALGGMCAMEFNDNSPNGLEWKRQVAQKLNETFTFAFSFAGTIPHQVQSCLQQLHQFFVSRILIRLKILRSLFLAGKENPGGMSYAVHPNHDAVTKTIAKIVGKGAAASIKRREANISKSVITNNAAGITPLPTLTSTYVDQCKAAFNKYDRNQDGSIELYELKFLLQDVGKDYSDSALHAWMAQNGDSVTCTLSFVQFLDICHYLFGNSDERTTTLNTSASTPCFTKPCTSFELLQRNNQNALKALTTSCSSNNISNSTSLSVETLPSSLSRSKSEFITVVRAESSKFKTRKSRAQTPLHDRLHSEIMEHNVLPSYGKSLISHSSESAKERASRIREERNAAANARKKAVALTSSFRQSVNMISRHFQLGGEKDLKKSQASVNHVAASRQRENTIAEKERVIAERAVAMERASRASQVAKHERQVQLHLNEKKEVMKREEMIRQRKSFHLSMHTNTLEKNHDSTTTTQEDTMRKTRRQLREEKNDAHTKMMQEKLRIYKENQTYLKQKARDDKYTVLDKATKTTLDQEATIASTPTVRRKKITRVERDIRTATPFGSGVSRWENDIDDGFE